MNITLKDGSVKVYDAPMTAADITKDISMGLYRAACCCRIDGQVRDLRTTVSDDCAFEVLTFDEEDGRRTFMTSTAATRPLPPTICLRSRRK